MKRFWHGAASTFLVWGLYQGALLATYAVLRSRLGAAVACRVRRIDDDLVGGRCTPLPGQLARAGQLEMLRAMVGLGGVAGPSAFWQQRGTLSLAWFVGGFVAGCF